MFARSSLSRTALIFLVMVLITFTACRNRRDEGFAPEQQAKASCTETCARRGQCGTLPDNRKAILANQSGPAVSLHDRFFTEGSVVTVIEVGERELIATQNGVPLIPGATPFPHTFYRVSTADKTAWVSSWCLTRP